jgi:hypothetical protein
MYIILIILIIILIYTKKKNIEKFLITKKQTNLFIILSPKVTKNMYLKYSEIIPKNLIFISDKKPEIKKCNIYYYPDKLMNDNGFYGMHSKIKITSWDKCFYYLQNNINNSYYWIIEDDCYLNKNSINNYFKKLENNYSDALLFGWYKSFINQDKWQHWNLNKNYFEKKHLKASINQIIRISKKLVEKILHFHNKNNKLLFHEILIPSTISKYNLTYQIINRSDIDNRAEKKNSIIYKIYKNNKQLALKNIKNKYIIIHPFKLWYDF